MPAVSFDRAADFYDATRALDPEVHARLTSMLVAELAGRGTCLEIGVGTGRIALPLVAAGVDLIGVDIAPKMLRRLIDNAGGRRPLPLAVADVTTLPFGAGRIGAVLASHVLHLIPALAGRGRRGRPAARARRCAAGRLRYRSGRPRGTPSAQAALRAHGVVLDRPGMRDLRPVDRYLEGRARARALAPSP